MARIKHKELIGHFIQTFYPEEHVFTGSQFKMLSIQMSNLKKVVRQYIIEANIDTELSTEEIIWNTIDYAGMKGCKFKSVASLGYGILPESIKYYQRKELLEKKKAEEAEKEEQLTNEEQKLKEMQEANNKRKAGQKKKLNWMLDD